MKGVQGFRFYLPLVGLKGSLLRTILGGFIASQGHMVHYAAFRLLAPCPRPALRVGDPGGSQAALCNALRAFGLQRLLDLLPYRMMLVQGSRDLVNNLTYK